MLAIVPHIEYFGISDELSISSKPFVYFLYTPHPNPFNPTTTISFPIPELGLTTNTAYTLMDRKLETLKNGVLNTGYHTINWNASSYPSGIYLIRMKSGSYTQTQKVVLVK